MTAVAAGTAGQALGAATDLLKGAGVDSPRLDAELLVAEALGADRATLIADPARELTDGEAAAARAFVRRRLAREPVAYILGRRAFRRVELRVDRRVLIPRPETELLVEVALDLPEGASVHDVGTGSGAIALAIADERPDLRVSASDASAAAVAVARDNAERLRLPVEIAEASLVPRGETPETSRMSTPGGPHGRFSPRPDGAWDLVVANLPYVGEGEWDGLAPEIRLFEPREALVAGPDGLDAIRALAAAAPPGQRLALEHAPHQAEAVRALLDDPETLSDLAGRERVTVGACRS